MGGDDLESDDELWIKENVTQPGDPSSSTEAAGESQKRTLADDNEDDKAVLQDIGMKKKPPKGLCLTLEGS
jgi:hypothetical protein